MNISKKVKLIISILATLSLLSQPVIAENVNSTQVAELSTIFNDDKLLDIKRVSEDSIEDVNLDAKNMNLANGTYILNRGTGWVLSHDKSYIKSAYAAPGVNVYVEVKDTVIKEDTYQVGNTVELDLKLLRVSVEKAFGITIKSEESLVTDFQIQAPADKNLFLKVYATYNRYDFIKVENNKIIGQTTSYEPAGSWMKYVSYKTGETVNQSELVEQNYRCILGEPNEVNMKSSIVVGGTNENGTVAVDSFKIGFDYTNNSVLVLDRKDISMHISAYPNQLFFRVRLLDKMKKEKLSIEFNGSEKATDKKLDKLDNYTFEIGDYIELYHIEPFRLKFNNVNSDSQKGNQTQIYRITATGLEPGNLPTGPEILPPIPPGWEAGPEVLIENDNSHEDTTSNISGGNNEEIN